MGEPGSEAPAELAFGSAGASRPGIGNAADRLKGHVNARSPPSNRVELASSGISLEFPKCLKLQEVQQHPLRVRA